MSTRLCWNTAGPLNGELLRYLKMHSISQKTAKRFRLGYVLDYAKTSHYLVDRFPGELLAWTGLFNDKGNFRFYKHRLLIPYTLDGRVVYVQGRTLDSRVQPKAIGLNRHFPCPFNIDVVKQDGVKKVYLCKGVIDALTLIERGLCAVGVPGVNCFRKEWVRFFKGKEILIVFDRDKPGESAARYVNGLFVKSGIESRVIVLPSGEDVNSYFEVLRQFEVV